MSKNLIGVVTNCDRAVHPDGAVAAQHTVTIRVAIRSRSADPRGHLMRGATSGAAGKTEVLRTQNEPEIAGKAHTSSDEACPRREPTLLPDSPSITGLRTTVGSMPYRTGEPRQVRARPGHPDRG